ncbi:hypothetical protein HDU98_002545 [Podochytrium sp. JEL0797]|nr:hypothetical protein HDU98_002545 [Podochytrium sp. JEL0797]
MSAIANLPINAPPRKNSGGKINNNMPTAELPIFNQLMKFRKSLAVLRKESHDALTLADVNAKAAELNELMVALRMVRFSDTHTIDENEPRNRLDDVLDQIWMSMFFIWGKIAAIHDSIYPTYVSLVTLARAADAVRASGAWTSADLEPLQQRVRDLDEQVANAEGKFVVDGEIPHGQAVLVTMLNKIHRMMRFLISETDSVGPELLPLHEELESILKQLIEMPKTGYTLDSLSPISKRLHAIDAGRGPTGNFHGTENQPGQATVAGTLNACFDRLTLMVADLDPVHSDSPLFDTYRALLDIHSSLARMLGNATLRGQPEQLSAALTTVQESLHFIEAQRVNGTFVPAGTTFEQAVKLPGQATMHKLLHDCHAQISHLVEPMSRPVGECLVPTYELLLKKRATLRKLRGWASAGWNVREDLNRVQEILKTVESTKMRGLFVGGIASSGELSPTTPQVEGVPNGQSTIVALVDECDSLVWQINCMLV